MSQDKKTEYAREYAEVVRPKYMRIRDELSYMMVYGTQHPEARDEKFLNDFQELLLESMRLKKRMNELEKKFFDESDD